MVKHRYVPDRGDIIWLEFNPQAGIEQAGTRPALVLTKKIFNERLNTALVCPITNTVRKGYPFQVELSNGEQTTGAVLCDQVKVLDWNARKARFCEKANRITLENTLALVRLLVA